MSRHAPSVSAGGCWLVTSCRITKTHQQPFAFRLHQFISPGDTVYASLDGEDKRHVTLSGQRYVAVDGQRQRLFPLCFCRECGQEYYTVRLQDSRSLQTRALPRDFRESGGDDDSEARLSVSQPDRAPGQPTGKRRLSACRRTGWRSAMASCAFAGTAARRLPRELRLDQRGESSEAGIDCVFLPTPFGFCLRCGISYARQRNDFVPPGHAERRGQEQRHHHTQPLRRSRLTRQPAL